MAGGGVKRAGGTFFPRTSIRPATRKIRTHKLFNTVPGFVNDVNYFHQELKLRPDLAKRSRVGDGKTM